MSTWPSAVALIGLNCPSGQPVDMIGPVHLKICPAWKGFEVVGLPVRLLGAKRRSRTSSSNLGAAAEREVEASSRRWVAGPLPSLQCSAKEPGRRVAG